MANLSEGGPLPVLEAGNYPCIVEDAEDGISKSGNQMVTLKVAIVDMAGKKIGGAFDHLVNVEAALWNVEAFLLSVAAAEDIAPEKFSEGAEFDITAAAVKGKRCTCFIQVEDKRSGDGQCNTVGAYLVPEKEAESPPAPQAPEQAEVQGDDLPFEGIGESKPGAFVAPE